MIVHFAGGTPAGSKIALFAEGTSAGSLIVHFTEGTSAGTIIVFFAEGTLARCPEELLSSYIHSSLRASFSSASPPQKKHLQSSERSFVFINFYNSKISQ